MSTRTEAEYWKERSRLLEEYVQNLPPASAFNAEGRAAYKEWSTFVNNEGIPMPPSEPLYTETQVKAMVAEILAFKRMTLARPVNLVWEKDIVSIAAQHGIKLP